MSQQTEEKKGKAGLLVMLRLLGAVVLIAAFAFTGKWLHEEDLAYAAAMNKVTARITEVSPDKIDPAHEGELVPPLSAVEPSRVGSSSPIEITSPTENSSPTQTAWLYTRRLLAWIGMFVCAAILCMVVAGRRLADNRSTWIVAIIGGMVAASVAHIWVEHYWK